MHRCFALLCFALLCFALPFSMDAMVHHTAAAARGIAAASAAGAGRAPLLVGDMPFGSYLTPNDAAQNAVRLLKEGGAGSQHVQPVRPSVLERVIHCYPVVGCACAGSRVTRHDPPDTTRHDRMLVVGWLVGWVGGWLPPIMRVFLLFLLSLIHI